MYINKQLLKGLVYHLLALWKFTRRALTHHKLYMEITYFSFTHFIFFGVIFILFLNCFSELSSSFDASTYL